MNTFKLLLLAAALISLPTLLNAQNSEPVNRELGLRMSGLSDFNFIYKKEIKENRFLRLRTGSLNLAVSGISESVNAGFTFGFGLENRKPIDSKLSFVHGFEPSLASSFSSSNQPFLGRLSLGYVLGFQLNVSEQVGINIETIPALGFTYLAVENDIDKGQLDFNFNSNHVAISLVYRFKK